jgi:aldehyde:ferredoxin oxidoreductase
MGTKKIKSVAVHGTKKIDLERQDELLSFKKRF